jgi:HAE1 family hydrophobic/amphiphilic exporter-1
MFLTNLSLKRPVFVTVSILALVMLGLISYFRLGINDWPDVEFPYVSITIVQAGASPEQIENKVALELEEALGQISGVKHTYTQVQEGVLVTWAEFTLETNPQIAAQNVREKLGEIRSDLPDDIQEPVISTFSPSSIPIMSLAVTGDKSLLELSAIVDNTVRRYLETIPGVGSVKIAGQEKREIQINLDQDKLAALGLSIPEVIASLQSENMDVPGGSLSSESGQVTVRTSGEITSAENFEQLPVARRGGIQLYVKDIATVADGIEEPDSIVLFQGEPAVGISIVKQSGQNTVKVADAIKKAVDRMESQLPPGVKVDIVRDNSLSIRSSVNDVVKTIFEGALLAVFMVFLFLRNWRSTLIGAVAIPTSIITTFLCMHIMGFTLNIMSLMALSLSVGLLIDDAIVVIENINRHLQMGKSRLEAARDASNEIGLAVMATTFTVIAVFLPVGMMTGQVAQFFKQFGITVVFSVLVSLFVSFTLVPLLSSRYLEKEEITASGPLKGFLDQFNKLFDLFTRQYLKILSWSLKRRLFTLGLAMMLFISSLAVTPLLGTGFVPTSDLGEFTISAEFDAGLNLAAAREMTGQIEDCLHSFPEVIRVYSAIETDEASIYVKMVDKNKRDRTIKEILAEMRPEFNKIPGVRVSMLLNTGMGEEAEWEFRLQGYDLDNMQIYAEQAQRILKEIPGVVDVSSSFNPGKPEIKLEVKKQEAADLGISTAQIAQTVQTLFTGTVVSQYSEGEERYDVRLRLNEQQRKNTSDLNNIYLLSAYSSAPIALNHVTEAVFSTAPNAINRSDRYKEIVLSGNLDGISLGDFNSIFLERVENEIQLPDGYRFYAGAETEEMNNTFSSMLIALFTGIMFIFFILASQFESYIDPFSIMLALPMAVVGAIYGLMIMGSELNLISMIGIIMLMGLVCKNAILLIDFTKQARQKGIPTNDALKQAALTRLRPIMMTSLAMIFGMIPSALGMGIGSEMRAPMAHAVIGGLITSTLLTLVVVPVIYSLLDDLKSKIIIRRTGKVLTPARQLNE